MNETKLQNFPMFSPIYLPLSACIMKRAKTKTKAKAFLSLLIFIYFSSIITLNHDPLERPSEIGGLQSMIFKFLYFFWKLDKKKKGKF